MKVDVGPFLVKSSVLLLILAWQPLCNAIPLCFFVTWAYQYVIAFIFGVHAMPSMDTICFMGNDKARVNFISITTIERYKYEGARARARRYLIEKPKLRYSIERIFGDYYWKDTNDIDRALNQAFERVPREFKDQKEIEKFVNEEINKPIPLDRPQWHIWVQENYQDKHTLLIYKQHHSMCDGISCINFHLGQGDNFDISALIPFPRKITLLDRIMIRLTFPIFLPRIAWGLFTTRQDRNPLHDGIRELSGNKISATSTDILFNDVKTASK